MGVPLPGQRSNGTPAAETDVSLSEHPVDAPADGEGESVHRDLVAVPHHQALHGDGGIPEDGEPTRLSPDTLSGRTIAHFRIGEPLGSGGMCEVYAAQDARLEARPIATMTLEAQERHERNERVYRDD